MTYEAKLPKVSPTYFELLEKATHLLNSTNASRRLALPVDDRGWTGAWLEEVAEEAECVARAEKYLRITGWILSWHTAGDMTSRYEKTLWSHELTPDLDMELLTCLSGIIDGAVALQDPRLTQVK